MTMKYHLNLMAVMCALALSACSNNKASGGNPAPAPQADAIVGYAQRLVATAPEDTEPDEIDGIEVAETENTEPSDL